MAEQNSFTFQLLYSSINLPSISQYTLERWHRRWANTNLMGNHTYFFIFYYLSIF